MALVSKISPCLWFDHQGEEAAKYYCGIFKNSKIISTSYYTEAGKERHHQRPGSVLAVVFELEGQVFTALNAGPLFKFSEAISFHLNCATQKEIDYYWEKLTPGGDPYSQVSGWLKDKFGLSWQIVPEKLTTWLADRDSAKTGRLMTALMGMRKLDIAELKAAFEGKTKRLNTEGTENTEGRKRENRG